MDMDIHVLITVINIFSIYLAMYVYTHLSYMYIYVYLYVSVSVDACLRFNVPTYHILAQPSICTYHPVYVCADHLSHLSEIITTMTSPRVKVAPKNLKVNISFPISYR